MSKGPFQKLIDKLVRQAGEKAELTYDDLNQAIPRDVVSPDRIDEVILALVERGIEVSDRSGAGKPRPKPSAAPGAPGRPASAVALGEEDEVVETIVHGRSNDPVRMYLRKMGTVSLLTREGEVTIAKRIEEGEKKVLSTILRSSIAVREILDLGDKLRTGRLRVRDVARDFEGEEVEFDEEEVVKRLLKQIEKIRRLTRRIDKVERHVARAKRLGQARREAHRRSIESMRGAVVETLHQMHLSRRQTDAIVDRLKELARRIDKCKEEIGELEARAGMDQRTMRRTIREMRKNRANARRVSRKLGVRLDDLLETDHSIKNAQDRKSVV